MDKLLSVRREIIGGIKMKKIVSILIGLGVISYGVCTILVHSLFVNMGILFVGMGLVTIPLVLFSENITGLKLIRKVEKSK